MTCGRDGSGVVPELLGKPLSCLENTESDHWFEALRGKLREWQWPAVVRVLEFCKRCGKDLSGEASGPIWTRGMLYVYAQPPRIGASQGRMGRTASSFSSP